MTKKKSILSMILVIAMIFTMMPFMADYAFADETAGTVDSITINVTPPVAGQKSFEMSPDISVDGEHVSLYQYGWLENLNENSPAVSNFTFEEGSTYYMIATIQAANGWYFAKGSTEYTINDEKYKSFDGCTVKGGTREFAGSRTIDGIDFLRVKISVTATKTQNYLISFDANGGSGEMDSYLIESGAEFTVPECTFTSPSEQKVFNGWNTLSAGTTTDSGTWYDPGDKITVTGNLKLYARWDNPFLSIASYDMTNSKRSAGGRFTDILTGVDFTDFASYGCNNYTIYAGDEYSTKAIPDDGYKFVGWYKGRYFSKDENGTVGQYAEPYINDDSLLSTDELYTFTVSDNMVICPVFREMTEAEKLIEKEKVAAIAALEKYKSLEDYRDAQKAELAKLIEEGKTAINAATDVTAVETALANAKAKIDTIKTDAQLVKEELATAKAEAKKALEDLKELNSAVAYSVAHKIAIAKAVVEGIESIEKAVSIDAVKSALANAKANIEKIKAEAAAEAAAETKAKKITSVTINTKTVNASTVATTIKAAGGKPAYVTTIVLGKKVKKISANSFKGTKVTTLTVKTKKLKKKSVKKSLKGSSVTTVKVKVGNKKTNKKFVKKYKKIFTKKNAGKKAKVK